LIRALPLLFGVLCALLLSGTSFAQAPTAAFDQVSGEARERFEQGMAAYEQGRFRAAIEHFKEADRKSPSARLSYNIALAYERMDDVPNALGAYRDYLRRLPDAENASETSVRIAELELALQKLGVQQLSVLSTPAGATVLLDGVSRGVTPWTGELPPGTHRLGLQLGAYQAATQDFELPARHTIDLVIQLQPVPSAAPAAPRRQAMSTAAVPLDTVAPTAGPRVRFWTWGALGSSAALLIASGAVELSRRSLEQDAANEELDQIATRQAYDAMQARMQTSRVLLGLGAVMGVVGGVSLYLDLSRKQPAAASIGLACSAGECGALARGYW